jgi:four helix bundle protein
MGDFQKLKVWKRAKNLAVSIYKTTEKGLFLKDYGLRDQIKEESQAIISGMLAKLIQVRVKD